MRRPVAACREIAANYYSVSVWHDGRDIPYA